MKDLSRDMRLDNPLRNAEVGKTERGTVLSPFVNDSNATKETSFGERQSWLEGTQEQMDKRMEMSDAYLRYIMRIFISLVVVLLTIILAAVFRDAFLSPKQEPVIQYKEMPSNQIPKEN